jgi:predicted TPR repeat methyltransferase
LLPDLLEDAGALLAAGRAGEAAALLRERIETGRSGLLLRLVYARALAADGKTQDALAAARETALLFPNVAAAILGLGEALRAAGQLPVAIAELQRALRLDPELDAARLELGSAWLDAGEADKALEVFAGLEPSTPGLAEKIAAAQSMRARPRSDAGYVRHLFDQFSADYDARMRGQLSYRAPEILRELAGFTLMGRAGLAILDLGCGTGLSGAAFADLKARLDGIDLSPAMIEKARARGVYDTLTVGDIENLPATASYDLVLAADTMVYLGELAPVLGSVARALGPGGQFLFTVERADGEGFELGPKRRWRHSESYLRAAAQTHGFAIAGMLDCVPRMEAGLAVEGLAVAFERPL